MNAEHEFVPSFDTNNNIVRDVNHDVNQRQSKLQKSITEYFEEVFSNFKEEQQFELHPRADGAKRRARVLIPPGYLHPGKRKH